MNDEVDAYRRYFDAQAASYDAYTAGDNWTPNVHLVELLSALVTEAPRRVLDLGTGTGQTLLAVHSLYPAAHLYGVDVSSAMLALASAKLPLADLQVADVSTHVRSLTDSYDLVTMIGTAELLADLPDVLGTLLPHVEPGGLIVLSLEPLVEGLEHLAQPFDPDPTRPRFPWSVADVVCAVPDAGLVGSRLFRAYRRGDEDVLYELLALRAPGAPPRRRSEKDGKVKS